MGLLISKNSSKWNNYVKNTLKDPDIHKQHRFNQETVDYLYHLQQQVDYLQREMCKLRDDMEEYRKNHDDGPILFCDPVGGGELKDADKYYYQLKKKEDNNDTSVQ